MRPSSVGSMPCGVARGAVNRTLDPDRWPLKNTLYLAESLSGSAFTLSVTLRGSLPSGGRTSRASISMPCWGDEIEYIVRWDRSHARATSETPLASLAGQPVRLRFVLKDTDLYSLRFQ